MGSGNRLNQNPGAVSCGVFSSSSILNMSVAASVVLKAQSGRFVQANGSGYISAGSATAVDIVGWVVGNSDLTAPATAGAVGWDVDTNFLNNLYLMPACKAAGAVVTAAELLGAIGTTFDIQMVSTYYQYANLGASTVDILVGYGYIYEGSAAGQQYMIVKVNPIKLAYGTHSDV